MFCRIYWGILYTVEVLNYGVNTSLFWNTSFFPVTEAWQVFQKYFKLTTELSRYAFATKVQEIFINSVDLIKVKILAVQYFAMSYILANSNRQKRKG